MRYKYTFIIFASLLLLLLSFNIISAVQVVEVPPKDQPNAQQDTQKSGGIFSFLSSPIFWYVFIGFLLFCLVMLGIFFLVRWIVKFIKQRSDIYWRMRNDRMTMAKIHARYACGHFWKVHKNTPIRLAKKDENGRLYISKPIGHHRGDYVTHEGNLILSMNLVGMKKFFFFPVRDLLIIPNREKVKILQRNERGEKIKDIEYTLPQAKDIVQWNENEILLFAEGVSKVGIFLIPVLKSSEGKIIDLALPVYQTLKEVILGNYLYEQSADFVALSKKAIDLNPTIRGYQKVSDANQNVEVTPSSHHNP